MENFIQRYKNARNCIKQIKSGEWRTGNKNNGKRYYVASRNGKELWLANGAFFCEIEGKDKYFGLFWRHFVWWLAARNLAKLHGGDKPSAPILD